MRRLIAVITEPNRDTDNTKSKADFDAVGGDLTFTVALSPTGVAPATHRICNWGGLPAGEYSTLAAYFDDNLGGRWCYDGDVTDVDTVLSTLGLQRIEGAE